MKTLQLSRRSLLALTLSLICACAFAQAQPAAKPFKPQVGQDGKDVIWVPTPQSLVNRMLDVAKVTSSDYLIDLGSGDGRTVITAARRGTRALGIEYNPDMVELSKQSADKAGVSARATFMKADLFETDLSQATVITMFLLPSINLKLRPKLLELKPGTRIVSNTFSMGEWEADETVSVEDENAGAWRTALLWIVPAKVEGTWRMPQGELTLKQDFQMLSGTLTSGSGALSIGNGRLRGDAISFAAGGVTYSGRVNGTVIQGHVKSANGSTAWQASRAAP